MIRLRPNRSAAHSLYAVLLCATGAFLADIAWSTPVALPLALLVPFGAAWVRRRWNAWMFSVGYFLAFARDVPYAASQFFPEAAPAWGVAAWVIHAGILALVYAFIRTDRAETTVVRLILATLLMWAPPFGLIAWGNPMLAAGVLFPGTGIGGLLLLLSFMATLLWASMRGLWKSFTGSLVGLVLVATGFNALYQEPALPDGWFAQTTHIGRIADDPRLRHEQMKDLVRLAQRAMNEGATVIVFPESIWGSRRPATLAHLERLNEEAKDKNVVLIVGEDLPTHDGARYLNALTALGVQEGMFSVARVPMPIGVWRMGFGYDAVASPFATDTAMLAGVPVAVAICYEAYILWPHWGLLTGQAKVLVASANQWSMRGRVAEDRQNLSRMVLARLAGVPLLAAVNH